MIWLKQMLKVHRAKLN